MTCAVYSYIYRIVLDRWRLSYYSLRATSSAGGMRTRRPYCIIQLVLRTDSRVLSEQAYECEENTYISPILSPRIRYPLGNCYRRWIVLGLAAGRRQLHGSSDAVSSHLVNPRGVGCFCHPLLTLGH